MALFKEDGDFSVATPIGGPVYSSPIPSTTDELVLKQEYLQFRADFTPLALDTAHPTATGFVLVAEDERRDAGGGLVQWTRTYAKVPSQHNEFETYGYQFIGLVGVWNSYFPGGSPAVELTGRPPIPRQVTCRVQHDYFNTTTPGAIASFRGQRYFQGSFLSSFETTFLNDLTGAIDATSPSRTEYVGWIANAVQYGFTGGVISNYIGAWISGDSYSPGDVVSHSSVFYVCTVAVSGSTVPGSDGSHWSAVTITNPSQIIPEDSRLTRWMGNIWLRQTRFVLAQ